MPIKNVKNVIQTRRFTLLIAVATLLLAALCSSSLAVDAADHVVPFNTSGPGETKAITNWGLDTCWADPNNVRRGMIFMGPDNVNIVRVGFDVSEPLVNGELTDKQKAALQNFADIAALAGPEARWDLNWASEMSPWYRGDSGARDRIDPERWAAAITAAARFYNRPIWAVEGFNEPDNPYALAGNQEDLFDVFGHLKEAPVFKDTLMAGGSTLNTDVGATWFSAVATRAKIGTIHCLAGTAQNYIDFIKLVKTWGASPCNPELHNVMEAILGVEYGLEGGIWWGTAERARGEFVKASQGKRLGYGEDRENWTAAAVYRAPGGNVQAFAGGVEREALTTTYRFLSTDRDVFYDGHGPQRAYAVTVPGSEHYQVDQPNSENVVNITWGEDVQPPIDGRYIVVNRHSGKVLEVADGGSANGAVLQQAAYTGALHQQWDINPMPLRIFQDRSFFSLKAANCGITADLIGWSYDNGTKIQIWDGGMNPLEKWYLEYAGDGYFRIHSCWSGKVLDVSEASKEDGAAIVQWEENVNPSQEWRLIPASALAYDFDAPAAPAGLTATANAVSVRLNWSANSEPDLAGYSVFRSTRAGGPYETIAREVTSTTFTDNSASQDNDYHYVVRAVDRSLNRSDRSAEAGARPTRKATLVAKYAFDGSPTDTSGNANNATIHGADVYTSAHVGPLSLELNGTDSYISLPPSVANYDQLTVAAWVYWNGGDPWQRLFDFGNGTSQYLFLSPGTGDRSLRFAVKNGAEEKEQLLESAGLPVGKWVHVAVTLGDKSARVYVDGVSVAETNSITIKPSDIKPALNLIGDSQFSDDPLFDGRIDDLRIYNYALSADEIAMLAGLKKPKE